VISPTATAVAASPFTGEMMEDKLGFVQPLFPEDSAFETPAFHLSSLV
jgi:hypothetical protein